MTKEVVKTETNKKKNSVSSKKKDVSKKKNVAKKIISEKKDETVIEKDVDIKESSLDDKKVLEPVVNNEEVKVEEKSKKKFNFKLIIAWLLPFLLLLITECFFVRYVRGYWKIHLNVRTLLMMGVFFYAIWGVISSIFKKSKISITVMATIVYILNLVSQIKIIFTEEPLFISDFLYLNDSGEIFSLVSGSIFESIKPIILPLILQLIVYIGLVVLAFFCNITFEKKKIRFSILGGSIFILLIFLVPIKFTNQFILKYIYTVDKRVDYSANVSTLDYYYNYGSMAGMYGLVLENRIYKPDDYDEDVIKEAFEKSPYESDKSLGKPNIIVVFSESFWNIDQLEEVKFDKPVASNFERLQEEGLFFNMISPSYGGISANVEFEFLTGGTLTYFNTGYVPYMQLYNNDGYYEAPTIIRELNNADYRTKLVPLSSSELFNCGKFYKYAEVDEVVYMDNVDSKYNKGYYTSDEYVTDLIIDEFNNKDKDERLFYMTMTMQAHMPYGAQKYDEYDIDVVESDLSPELNATLRSYAQGIYDADKQLGRLYEYIQTLDEPTIIVFYGDHLPYLQYQKQNALNELKYFNTDDSLLNLYRKYNTQSLILANYDISTLKEENNTELKYLGPDLLSAYMLNHMDIEISDYYRWLYGTRNTIGAYNFGVTIDQNGNLYSTKNLDGELKKLYNLRRNVQYKYFIK